jgi:hypothetical protein
MTKNDSFANSSLKKMDFATVGTVEDKDLEEKVASCKERGNAAFKRKRFEDAERFYSDALEIAGFRAFPVSFLFLPVPVSSLSLSPSLPDIKKGGRRTGDINLSHVE